MPPPAPTAASWRWSPTSSSFASAPRGDVVDGGEGGGVGHGRLVDHDQVARRRAASRGRRRTGGRRRGGAGWRASGRCCGRSGLRRSGRRWRSGWSPARPPGAAAPSHRAGSCQAWARVPTTNDLPGAGRADQRLDAGAGGEHAAHGGGLVGAELDPGLGRARRGTPAASSRGERGGACVRPRRRRRRVRCGRARRWRTACPPGRS